MAPTESASITSAALAERTTEESGSQAKQLWADVMSDLSDSTDAPDPSSLQDEESEENSGHHSGGESAGSTDDAPKNGPRCVAAATPLTLASARFDPLAADVRAVVSSLQMFLYHSPVIAQVYMQEGDSGSTTITAELSDASLNDAATKEAWILEPARQALSAAAQGSQRVYVLGYCAESFENFYGEGFKATLGAIPTEDEDKVCWDTWQWGYCARRSCCRWKHPRKQDLTEVCVYLSKPKRH